MNGPSNVCPASGLDRQECLDSICDCFYEQFPDDPYSLHPELFMLMPPEKKRDDL